MTAWERLDVDPERSDTLARGDDLSGLKGVLFAAREVEADGALELASDGCEIPPLSVAAMLGHEPRRAVHERRSATALDRRAQVGELGIAHPIGRREELRP